MNRSSLRIFIVGSALAVFSATSAYAQTETTQNPFDNKAPSAASSHATAPKKRAAPALKAGQFATEAEAKTSCPGDTVVWVNTGTKVYHHAGTAAYGKTKQGVYMCEKGTAAAGYRAAKNEKKSS